MNLDSQRAPLSRNNARMVLSAWDSSDFVRLRDALDQVRQRLASSEGSDEQERMETIIEVAERMQGWLRNTGESDPVDIRISLRVLRHLGELDPLGDASKVSPRLEMPASYPRQRSIPQFLALR
jgi:hypothetical protein